MPLPPVEPDSSNLERDDWREARRLVMAEISRMSRTLESIDTRTGSEMTNMKVEIATIKAKTGIYAAIVAATASILFSALISYLMRHS